MKRIFTLSFLLIGLAVLVGSCTKRGYYNDEDFWLSQERGVIVYSGFDCDFFVVETRYGYTVIRSWGGFTPLRGAVVYGNFSRFGVQSFYNRSEGIIQQGNVIDYWLTYWDAIDLADFECNPF